MKHFKILFIFVVTGVAAHAQTKYNQVGQLGEYKSDWLLVELDKKLGFINDNGKEIIKPTYELIGPFGEYKSDWVLVKLHNKFGFIDDHGKEIIKPI